MIVAKKRGIGVSSLTFDEYLTFVGKPCSYCGNEVDWSERSHSAGKRNSSGGNLDRKDSSRGYSLSNCCVCCADCNRTKLNLATFELMVAIGHLVKLAGGWSAIKSGNQDLAAITKAIDKLTNKKTVRVKIDHPELSLDLSL
jgi:hypothetical protein